eukprot:4625470-Pyramimonas_sp.AAC.1
MGHRLPRNTQSAPTGALLDRPNLAQTHRCTSRCTNFNAQGVPHAPSHATKKSIYAMHLLCGMRLL